jgi:hypothetical protein
MLRAEARRCLMAYGAIKMANLVRDHHVDPVAPLGHKGREVMLGRGQRGGKFRLSLPKELAHDGLLSQARWAFTGDT